MGNLLLLTLALSPECQDENDCMRRLLKCRTMAVGRESSATAQTHFPKGFYLQASSTITFLGKAQWIQNASSIVAASFEQTLQRKMTMAIREGPSAGSEEQRLHCIRKTPEVLKIVQPNIGHGRKRPRISCPMLTAYNRPMTSPRIRVAGIQQKQSLVLIRRPYA
jgi:hypothetical protein